MLTFQLLKYSSTPDAPQGVKNFNWSHVQNGLVVVFDSFRGGAGGSGEPMQMLKVIQGTRILEETPLQELIESGKALMQTMRAHNATVTADQLPISALAKSPLVGIRYNLPGGMARRYQLKFASVEHYDSALDFLLRIDLHIGQSNQAQGVANSHRPKSSAVHEQSASNLHSSSTLESWSNRPSTAIVNSQLHVERSTSSIVQENTDTARRPFTVESAISSTNGTSSTILPFEQSSTQRALTLPSRFTTQEDQVGRPSSAYSDLVNRERHPQPGSRVSSSDPLNPPEWFDRPATSSPLAIVPERSFGAESRHATPEHPPGKKIELPPRRELPFTRPGTARPSSRSSIPPPSQRPGTTMAAPTLLPPTTYGRSSSNTRSTIDPMDLDPLPEPTFIENAAKPIRPTSASSASKAAQSRRPPTPRNSSQANPQEHTTRRSSSIQPPPNFTHADSAEDRIFAELSGNASGAQSKGLDAYAMHSADGRKVILNDFMLQHIDDDNFVTLCEDMSACWATIGLGLM
ncbi:hypothetical protein BDV96DRAFT_631393 [Lophiotrema nucula]|uniref:Uncharacterized protein n=1 Tax=Lophiotrema nucula TaxID=690887 RepID=A0A6A5ZD12_9PLEO|nr:hypothetical protein BDV96DRAFT_631393 [Lophiotrema nucula]